MPVGVISIAPKPTGASSRQARSSGCAPSSRRRSARALRREIGDVPDITALLTPLRWRCPIERSWSFSASGPWLERRHGVRLSFGIDKQTPQLPPTFKSAGTPRCSPRQTKSTRKFDNEAVKQAVFGIRTTPSNYEPSHDVDLPAVRVLGTVGHCPVYRRSP